jgi:hypothetical protein
VDVYLRPPDVRPEPPSHYRPEVSAAIDDVLLRALSHAPNDRWSSATDFADNLQAAATAPHGYRPARAPGREPARREASTARWVALVSSSIVLFVVGLYLGFTLMR